MNSYIFSAPLLASTIEFNYGLNSLLTGFKIEGDISVEHHTWFMRNMPSTEEDLKTLVKKTKQGKLEIIEPDLSFKNFYDLYKYKVGNKKKAERLWGKLSRINKIKALKWMSSYSNELKQTGAAKMYPETYINQQRWNN